MNNIFKKSAVFALSAAVCLSYMIPMNGMAAKAEVSQVICDISQGGVIIENDKLTYSDASGERFEAVAIPEEIVVTGTTTTNTIYVRDWDYAGINMTFRDLNIDVTAIPAEGEDATGYVSTCAVYLGGESEVFAAGRVNVNLEGNNTIKSLDYAGIAVPMGETVRFDGEGSLYVTSVKGNSGVTAPAIGSTITDNAAPASIISDEIDTNFGTIIIDGGTIVAESEGTGIGGGQHSLGGTIVINGGNVTARATSSSAAGIGVGQDSQLGSILITGGVVNAEGSNCGSGIGGGGMHTDSGIITITGGDITAKGGNYAAGIGAGQVSFTHGQAVQIDIYDGNITAIGGYGAAGIGGGGLCGLAENITISGGTIIAQGGEASSNGWADAYEPRWGPNKTLVGKQISFYLPGSGIGNGGAYVTKTVYTSGEKAGTEKISQTENSGGNVTITGGTIQAYSGDVPETVAAYLADAQLEQYEAEGIGNGGIAKSESVTYTPCNLRMCCADVVSNGVQVCSIEKKDQKINGPSAYSASYGCKDFTVYAYAMSDLSYKSSNTSVASVSSAGKVTIKGVGTATITIKAAETDEYNAASKTVKITVKKGTQILKATALSKTLSKKTLAKKSLTTTVLKDVSAKTKISYKKATGSASCITVNTTTGKVTVKKGTKAGKYTANILVKAASSSKYNSTSKLVTSVITVK